MYIDLYRNEVEDIIGDGITYALDSNEELYRYRKESMRYIDGLINEKPILDKTKFKENWKDDTIQKIKDCGYKYTKDNKCIQSDIDHFLYCIDHLWFFHSTKQ
jgi:hypothetical protein